jgi:peroxiredoxin Q/BCP
MVLKVGEKIPPFKAKDFVNDIITDDDFLGSPVIIYFYPKDDTPGCTKEACGFRDAMESFEDKNVMVIGISPDSPNSHQKFIDKYDLNFPLIADENLALAEAFGVLKEKEGGGKSLIRTTFLCDSEGMIRWVESPVNVEGHMARIEEALATLVPS